MTSTSRGRLLAGAALGLGLAIVAPQQAQAACVVSANAYTCPVGTTTTTDTTGTAATDRNGPYTTAIIPIFMDIPAGATVNGLGAALSETGTGAQDLTITNNGAVIVNAGTPTAGGDAAFSINFNGATDVLYSGAGTVSNLGTGDGLEFTNAGTGSLTVNTTGAISAANGIGLSVNNVAGSGATSLTTGAVSGSLGGIHAILGNTAGDLTVVANGAITGGTLAGQDALRIQLTNPAATGNVLVTNNVSATGYWALTTSNAGSGDVTVSGNGSYIGTGSSGRALYAESTGGGDVTITGTGVVTATNQGAIFASSTGGNGNVSVTRGGAVTGLTGIEANAAGTGTVGVTTTAGGTVTSTAGNAITTTAVDGLTTINLAAAVNATGGDAIDATATGTGGLVISSSGNITSDATGIDANATTGTIGVTLTGGADVTGTVSGIDVSSTGNSTVTVGTGSVVTGGTQAILLANTGTATITNAGTIGAAVTDVAINAAAASAATITNSGTIRGDVILTAGADTLTNTGTLTAGDLDFGAGADTLANSAAGTITVAGATPILGLETFNNAGTVTAATGLTFDGGATALTNTGTLNAQGTLDFGAGADSFANSGAGIFNLTGATTLAGLETFTNSGRINLNTFTLTGPAVAFNNTGTIDTSGSAALAGFTTFSNAGTLDLAAGTFTVPAAVFTNTGTILADEGATTITGQTSFANSGTIDLQDGAVGDVLTINSAFVGSGGSNLDIDFTGAASDRLVIVGAASGSTAIDAAYLGGGFNLDGVLVVDTTTSTAGAFTLGSVTGDSPLLDVSLVRAGEDFFLVAAPTEATFNPLVVPGFATDIWYQSANEVFAETVKPATTSGLSFWGDVYISREKYGDDDDTAVIDGIAFEVDNELKTKRHGIQGGVDYGFDAGRVGLTGGYGWARAEGNAQADLRAKGWNLGIYGQFGGLTGFHGEFLAKHDEYDGEFTDGAFDGEEFDIRANGIDGSLGYRFGMGGAAVVDVHAGVSHVRTKVDDISAFGFNYDIGKLTSTRGRAGVRAILGGSLAPYVDATVYHEFSDDGEVELFDGANTFDFDTGGKGTWARFEAGLSGNDGPGPILAAWADFGDRKGLGLRAGWRLGGRVAEAAPPPPPAPYVAPPAPPPPATQTCPDGSVILATDACPPPPPPPPPAPEPERG